MRLRLVSASLVLASLALVGTAAAWAQRYGTHLDGRPITALAPEGSKAVVLYFIASDCPISNRTLPEMLRVRAEFRSRGVAFWFVYPNTTETRATVRDHAAAYDTADATLFNPSGSLVALTHARVTPEAAVLIPKGSSWKTVYLGRIDNRYVRLGLARPQATQHFAEQAVAAILNDKPVPPAVGNPVGCAIVNPKAPLLQTEQPSLSQAGGQR